MFLFVTQPDEMPLAPRGMTFQAGMKLEAIDPLNLSCICVATVQKVFCRIESLATKLQVAWSLWCLLVLPVSVTIVHNQNLNIKCMSVATVTVGAEEQLPDDWH